MVSFVLVAAAGAALALWVTRAPITGGIHTDGFSVAWVTNPSTSGDMGTSCGASVDNGALKLNIVSAFPGQSCDVASSVRITGATSGRIVGLDLPVPAGWTVTVLTGCGVTAPPNTLTDVKIRLTMGPDAVPGQDATFPQGAAGVVVVPVTDAPPALQAGCVS